MSGRAFCFCGGHGKPCPYETNPTGTAKNLNSASQVLRSVGRKRSKGEAMFSLRLRPVLALGLVAVMGTALCGTGRADTPAQKAARRDIVAVYAKISRAAIHKDLAPLAQAEADDFQDFTAMGTLNRDQSLELARQFFASTNSISKAESKILSWTWRGPDAVVIAQNTTVATARRNGKSVRLEAVNTSRDYWSRTGKGWQVRQSVDRGTKLWINGRRVQ